MKLSFNLQLLLICILFESFIKHVHLKPKPIMLYDPVKDDIEILDSNTYEKTILNSPKATILELFAHWCGN